VYEKAIMELYRLLERKTSKYGTDNLKGEKYVLERIGDKIARLTNSVRQSGRGREDDWMDLAGYAIIGRMMSEGEWPGRPKCVYFSHPNPLKDPLEVQYADEILADLCRHYSVFRPVGSWLGQVPDPSWIWKVCLEAIYGSDILVALLLEPSNGVAAEMLVAKLLGKRVYTLCSPGTVNSSLVQFASDVATTSVDGLFEALSEARHEEAD
jgi:hypothetical protein